MSNIIISTFIFLFICFSYVSLSYYNLTVTKHKWSGEHSCMSSKISIAILNEACAFRSTITVKTFWKWSANKLYYKNKNIFRTVLSIVTVNGGDCMGMHCAWPGDYQSLSLTRIEFNSPKVTPWHALTLPMSRFRECSASVTLTPGNGTTANKVESSA